VIQVFIVIFDKYCNILRLSYSISKGSVWCLYSGHRTKNNGLKVCRGQKTRVSNRLKVCREQRTRVSNGLKLCRGQNTRISNGLKVCREQKTRVSNGLKVCRG
jgi:hypothetical protein